LKAICDTGAYDRTVAELGQLIVRLDATPQPFAGNLPVVLWSVLSYRNGDAASGNLTPTLSLERRGSLEFIPVATGIPKDVVERAQAALRRQG
jgi:hypothetical protein